MKVGITNDEELWKMSRWERGVDMEEPWMHLHVSVLYYMCADGHAYQF